MVERSNTTGIARKIISHPGEMTEIVVRRSFSGTPYRGATFCAVFRWSWPRCDHRLLSGIAPRCLRANPGRLPLQKLRCARANLSECGCPRPQEARQSLALTNPATQVTETRCCAGRRALMIV